ncbi:hypothetical protein AU252_21695 [Pseudarthrobacter sulfonivorans]|uniref:Uncharacterized protein n=1 Tax=Pseudarthrobacter sulfonivorans TaxID=121292 RepID=A0A0U3PID2_9MICC|nr:hypothetical protein AU252_21695 [Pseudarthrobacter sulfonivorans]
MGAGASEHRNVQPPRNAASTPAKKDAPAEHRVQVAAARLRVTLDERLGRLTPPQTKALAKEPT